MKLASAKLLRRPYTILSGQPCVCWLVSFMYTRSREHIWLYQSAGDRSIYTAERALCRRPNERGSTSVFARICAIYKKNTHTQCNSRISEYTQYTHTQTHTLYVQHDAKCMRGAFRIHAPIVWRLAVRADDAQSIRLHPLLRTVIYIASSRASDSRVYPFSSCRAVICVRVN